MRVVVLSDKTPKEEQFSRRHLQREKVKVRILKMHVAYIEKRIIDDLREYCGIETRMLASRVIVHLLLLVLEHSFHFCVSST